jgi:predicted permease
VLLVGAGLMLRSFMKVLDIDLGFQPSQAYTMKVIFDDGGQRANRGPVQMELLRRVKEVPGVEQAGITDMLPLGRNRSWGLKPVGEEFKNDRMQPIVIRVVTPGYLEAMGMRRLRGRDFSWSDGPDSKTVLIINEAAEKAMWKGKDSLGREAMQGNRKAEVIAVLRDVKDQSVEKAPGPEMYMMVTQAGQSGAELVVRSKRSAADLALPVMQALRSYTPEQPAVELMPLGRIVDRANSVRRFIAMLVAAFAGLGLVLAMLGVYGVISYSVTRQRQEIGIRMALGASGGQVRLSVVSSAMKLALVGLAGGMIAAWLAGNWIEGVLYGTSARDPWTYVGIAFLLAAVSLLAALQPAWRASRIDPMGALRSQ